VLSAEAGDTLSEGDESMQHSQRSSAHGGITSSSDSKPAAGGLAGAFKRLQARVGLLRTQVRGLATCAWGWAERGAGLHFHMPPGTPVLGSSQHDLVIHSGFAAGTRSAGEGRGCDGHRFLS
jgi:hypothetical protein